MFNELREYEKTHDMTAPGGHYQCLKILAYASEELVKFSPRNKMLDYINRESKLTAGLMKLILTSINTGEVIKDGDPELGVK